MGNDAPLPVERSLPQRALLQASARALTPSKQRIISAGIVQARNSPYGAQSPKPVQGATFQWQPETAGAFAVWTTCTNCAGLRGIPEAYPVIGWLSGRNVR